MDINELCIEKDKTILEAMEQLNKNSRKVLFVQENGKLLAAITDGDIRRWILNKGDVKLTVECAANFHPVYLYEDQEESAVYTMKKHHIEAIPIVDENHIIKRITFATNTVREYGHFNNDIPVVIMAGGLGTRLSPYTNVLPKPLIPIGDYPIAEHIINRFQEYGCNQFYMIVNYKRNMIKAYFDEIEKNYQLEFITEEKALGTGGGISLLKGKINSTFILTNCDILIDDDLTKAYRQHVESGNLITMVCSLKKFIIPYGVVNIGENGVIKSMQEKPNMSFLTNTGCYFVEPEVIEDLEYNEPVDFPIVIEKYIDSEKKIGVYPISGEAWLDMGQIDELEKMKARLG